MSQQHICYYSTRDRYSQNFLEELSRTPYAKEFRFVCVDPSPSRPPLPSYLKAVPTLMIAGEPEPRTDAQVMNWLSERRLMGEVRRAPPQANGGGLIVGGTVAPGGAGPDGLDAYFSGDDSGAYTFLDEPVDANGSMSRLSGPMAGINDTGMVMPDARISGSTQPQGPGPAQGSASGPKQSAKSAALDSAYERLLASRSMEVPGPHQRR